MRRLLLPLLLLFLTLGLVIAVTRQLPFANGPAEWEWAYRPAGLEGLGLIAAAALMVILTWVAAQDRPTDWRWALPLLVVLGWALTLDLARAQPEGFRRIMRSLASRHSFGYVFDEGLAPDTRELLADYPAATAGLNQHARTHPPGPLLAVRGLDAIGRRLPPAKDDGGLVSMAADSLRREIERAAIRGRPVPRRAAAPGTLLLLALLLPALSALAAWPLHRLSLRLGLTPAAALFAVALWLLVPARSVFTPSLDQALPAFLVASAWLATGREKWRAVLAGLFLALCAFFSYGYLAAAPLVGLLALTAERGGEEWPRIAWRFAATRTALLIAGFLLPWLALALFSGYDLWEAFRSAMVQHRAIAVTPRGYSTWLVWNPYDFALLLGPVALGLAAAALRARAERTPGYRALAWGWWGLIVLLLVSGSVRGEVGRIWLMLMPFACLLAAGAAAERWSPRSPWPSLFLLAEAALLVALAANLVFVA
ncbi:MAG TPA: hypothetical protein VF756_00295 [Thermoanaerobaculia bacterium]